MTPDTHRLAGEIRHYGITRLCHLTPSRNLVHIAAGSGLLSVDQLNDDNRAVFTAQDRVRVDGHLNHISCSIQYPNAWYLRHKRNPVGEASNFKDWVVLGINPRYMLHPNTLFSPGNAAEGGGMNLRSGLEGFEAMYAESVTDSRGRVFSRENGHLRVWPTNDQAEVMICAGVSLEDIEAIFVPDSAQAARIHEGLNLVGAEASRFRYVIAESFFNATRLSAEIRNGKVPTEIEWDAPT